MIIDFHTHTFPAKAAPRIIAQLTENGHIPHHTDGTPEGLAASMQAAGIGLSVNLPVMTRVDQVEHVNSSLIERYETLLSEGILTFGGLHPDMADPKAEIRRLKENGIQGVKLHPAYQQTDLNDIRYLRMIDALSEAGLITVVHAGHDIGFPGHNFASVAHILDLVETVRPEKFVLAHMGGWQDWDRVEKDLCGLPVYLDTAFAIGPLDPFGDGSLHPLYRTNLSNGQFVRIVRKHGADRVLFGSDSPWSGQKAYVDRLNAAGLTDCEKAMIFGRNSQTLLGLDAPSE